MAETIRAINVGTKFVLDADALRRIRDVLGAGGLVVYPTDTVYGLAADPFQEAAIARVYAAKERPRDLTLSMAVADSEALFRYGVRTPLAEAFCTKNLPGPYTVVLRATEEAPKALVSPQGLLGQRIPNHPIPRLLSRGYGPVTATSANRHGQPSPTTCDEARDQLGDLVELYLDGGPAPSTEGSTVVDLSGPKARILRAGVGTPGG